MGGENKSTEPSFVEILRAHSAEAEAAIKRATELTRLDREGQIAFENQEWAKAHFEKIKPILEKAAKMSYRESIVLAINPSDSSFVTKVSRDEVRSDDLVVTGAYYRLIGKAASLALKIGTERLKPRTEMNWVQELMKAEPHPHEALWKETLKPSTSDFEHLEADVSQLIVLIASW